MINKETLQQIANDERRSRAERIAAFSEMVHCCDAEETADKQLEDLLAGVCTLAPSAPHSGPARKDGVPQVEVEPEVRRAYSDLTRPKIERLLGRFTADYYPEYFERLRRLHSETQSSVVRAKAEETMNYYLTDKYHADLRDFAREVFGDVAQKMNGAGQVSDLPA